MPKVDLQNWLVENSAFRKKVLPVIIDSVSAQFPSLARMPPTEVSDDDWAYLLFCASLLSGSERDDCQDIALRIAQACMTGATNPQQRDTAALVLDDLANRLALDLSLKRELLRPNLPARLGVLARLEWTRRSLENSIALADRTIIETNRFQTQFWTAVQAASWTSASAPTSAGKSFIVLQTICDFFLRNHSGVVIYIVPTRALIHQVETDFRALRQQHNLATITVSSIPLAGLLRDDGGNFFVFTQERLHLFLSAFSTPPHIDLIIVDEAHKIGDGARGVLLQDVIERVTTTNPALKVIFASPQTENPETLLSDAPAGAQVVSFRGNDITVNQNLIWATQISGKPKEWEISLCFPDALEQLGKIQLSFAPTVTKRLPFVAHALTSGMGGNLIYVDGAAAAENVAQLLYDLLGEIADVSSVKAIADLIQLSQTAIHQQYALARVLKRGVAFHYGNMPLIVRDEIERCFNEGHIKYLVCTSTLVEGVNLPCRNIFVRGPKKGHSKPMNEADFWNLAGRAGRWGREFQGNIICVDATNPSVWRTPAPRQRTRYRIERTTEKILRQPDSLIEFISAKMPRDQIVQNPDLEFMGSYLVAAVLRSGSVSNTPFASRLDEHTVALFQQTLSALISNLTVPHDVILRNPGINPVSIDRLYTYFSTREGDVEELLPVLPTSDDAVERYIQIFSRINREVAPAFGVRKRVVMLAMLVVSWMRGYALKRLITERWDFERERDSAANLATIIRAVMKDVEEVARFQAPKYLSCYVDALRQHLLAIGRPDLITSELDINILLEFGVPGGTQLSLMGLGLSRTSALALAEFIAADQLTERDCLTWLAQNDWRNLNLPTLVKREIEMAVQLAA